MVSGSRYHGLLYAFGCCLGFISSGKGCEGGGGREGGGREEGRGGGGGERILSDSHLHNKR